MTDLFDVVEFDDGVPICPECGGGIRADVSAVASNVPLDFDGYRLFFDVEEMIDRNPAYSIHRARCSNCDWTWEEEK